MLYQPPSPIYVTPVINNETPFFSSAAFGSIVAVVGVILGASATYMYQRRLYVQTGLDTDAQRRRDHAAEQLARLYGPLLVLVKHSAQLHKIISQDRREWRLIDHVEEAKTDEACAAIIPQILVINRRIEDLIVECAGLVQYGEVPVCFMEFLRHARVVEAAVEANGRTNLFNGQRYPRELDEEVDRVCSQLRAELGLLVPPTPQVGVESAGKLEA